jgi:RNA polymerase sigma-70 factor (ECF subfamily)
VSISLNLPTSRPRRFQNRSSKPSPTAAAARSARFDVCFREHYARVLAYARRRLPDRATAEDVAAETFVVAWRRLDEGPGDQLPWLLGIARLLVLNELRSGRRRDRLMARVGAEPRDSDARPGTASEPPPVLEALRRLSEQDQEILLLVAWEGLDHARAARVVGCSRGAFMVRLHRARARLTRELAGTSASRRPNDLELA